MLEVIFLFGLYFHYSYSEIEWKICKNYLEILLWNFDKTNDVEKLNFTEEPKHTFDGAHKRTMSCLSNYLDNRTNALNCDELTDVELGHSVIMSQICIYYFVLLINFTIPWNSMIDLLPFVYTIWENFICF